MRVDPLDFALSYHAEAVDFSPCGDRPSREYTASEAGLNHGPWLHVRIAPNEGDSWIAAFELTFERSTQGLFGMPSGAELLVVAGGAGYVVSAHDSEQWHRVPLVPVHGVRRVVGLPIIALWGDQDLAAYGPDGPMWRVTRFGQDGLHVQRADSAGIVGSVWCAGALPSGDVPFLVDPWTGRVMEGPQPGASGRARTLAGKDASGG